MCFQVMFNNNIKKGHPLIYSLSCIQDLKCTGMEPLLNSQTVQFVVSKLENVETVSSGTDIPRFGICLNI